MSKLFLEYCIVDKLCVVKLQGDCSYMNYTEIEKLIKNVNEKYDTLIFNMQDVNYIDSSTIATFVMLAKKQRLYITNNHNGMVGTAIRLLQIDKWIHLFPDLESIFEHLGKEYTEFSCKENNDGNC